MTRRAVVSPDLPRAVVRAVATERLRRVGPVLWELSRDETRGMRVPARVFADEELLEAITGDRSL